MKNNGKGAKIVFWPKRPIPNINKIWPKNYQTHFWPITRNPRIDVGSSSVEIAVDDERTRDVVVTGTEGTALAGNDATSGDVRSSDQLTMIPSPLIFPSSFRSVRRAVVNHHRGTFFGYESREGVGGGPETTEESG